MQAINLKASNFRNFEQTKLRFGLEINIFYGRNGSGKTNLLEGIHLSCLGRSQRSSVDAVMVRKGAEVCRVEAEYKKEARSIETAVAFARTGNKKVTIDSVIVPLRELFSTFAAVSVGPEDSAVLSGSPSCRRGFIDFHLSQLSGRYLADLSDYQRCLAQRNAALKQKINPEPFDELFVQLASKIIIARTNYLQKLSVPATALYERISGGGALSMDYQPTVDTGQSTDEETICEQLHEKMARVSFREQALGSSLVGPHRDDMMIAIDNQPARTHGSQGEWRTGAISLKLAAYDILKEALSSPPILLLDEIFAELDEGRTEALIESFAGFGQLFLTTATKPPEQLTKHACSFRIDNGQVEEVNQDAIA